MAAPEPHMHKAGFKKHRQGSKRTEIQGAAQRKKYKAWGGV